MLFGCVRCVGWAGLDGYLLLLHGVPSNLVLSIGNRFGSTLMAIWG